MKLRGSITEQVFREELINSSDKLKNTNEGENILNTLRKLLKDMNSAYIIDGIPDQEEDFYTILINTDRIVKVEVKRESKSVVSVDNPINWSEYKKGLSKINQVKLAVAIDLAKNAT